MNKRYLVITYSWSYGMDERLDFERKPAAWAYARRIAHEYDGVAILDKQRRKVVFVTGDFPVWQLSL